MGAHSATRRRQRPSHKRKAGRVKKWLILTAVALVMLVVAMDILGSLLPAQKAPSGSGRPHAATVLYDYSVNISPSGSGMPYTTTRGHVTAVVKIAQDGVKSLLLLNTGAGWTSAAISLAQLRLGPGPVTAHNVWTGKTAVIRGVRVSMPPGGTYLYTVK